MLARRSATTPQFCVQPAWQRNCHLCAATPFHPGIFQLTHEKRFEELWRELERVGVDPRQFPAGLDVRRDVALGVLAQLQDGAGPAAFLSGLRAALSGANAAMPSGPQVPATDATASSSSTNSSPK